MRFQIQSLLSLLAFAVHVIADFTPDVRSSVSEHHSETVVYFDDSSVVLNLNHYKLSRSENDGKDWTNQLEDVQSIYIDKIKKDRAFAFSSSKTHYVSNDRGKTWDKFEIDVNSNMIYEVNVNSKNPDLILMAFVECHDDYCSNDVYYTTDGFKSNPKLLYEKVTFCSFTKSNGVFDEGHDNRILCLKSERDSYGYIKKTEIVASNDFFDKDVTVINDDTGILATSYVLQISIIQTFIVAVVQSDKYDSEGASVFLFVSKDGIHFKKAVIEGNLVANAFSFLPSTKSSLHISAWGSFDDGGAANILSSDSQGVQFRNLLGEVQGNQLGFLNLEKIETIEGVWTANILDGYDSETSQPKSKTKITLDDGRTWSYLKVDECDGKEDCTLNLLSLEERRGDGQGSTGATPGILLGIGNAGSKLDPDVFNLHTYVSRDGGLNWKRALDEPTIFAFGDLGNVILAAPYKKEAGKEKSELLTKKVFYSLDQGNSFQTLELEKEFFPFLLTTTIDGTSSKFILTGLYKEEGVLNQILYAIDFSRAFDKTCGKDDLEVWYGRTDVNGEGTCVFGHKDAYTRRKQDAKCFINKIFEDLRAEETPCSCAEEDFECSFGFSLNSKGECVANRRLLKQLCAETSATSLKIETKRKIPGNLCEGGDIEIPEQSVSCDELNSKGKNIETTETSFEGNVVQYIFMETTETSSSDETLLLRTSRNQVYISHNGGKKFLKYPTNDEVVEIYLNRYSKDDVYFITADNTIHYSYDRANTFHVVKSPSDNNIFSLPLLTFNNATKHSFIFYGNQNCESQFSDSCVPAAFITSDSGKNWKLLKSNVRRCDFVGARYTEYDVDENLVYCQVYAGASGVYSLDSSADNFATSKVEFEKIVGFATTTHYTVIAAIEGDSLKAYVTVDGKTFAEALFPKDFVVSKQQAYTILGSETGAVFLHVTNNERVGSEYGAILKSNSNGTSYVLSEKFVNRNGYGYVDYERVEGLEGIAISNIVKNPDSAKRGSLKQIQSKITFNDGSDWDYIQPPIIDSEGKKYECIGRPFEECSLHLHGYTERKDYRDTFSSGSATGLLIGVGNVGDKLTPLQDGSTYLTSDGGSTWKEIKKGVFQWEFGDRGSIIVLVDDQTSTNVIHYSLDEGNSWDEYQFAEDTVKVDDIVTVPSDSSKRFLLIARSEASRGEESRTFNIDFEDVFVRQCVLDFDHPDKDDFEYWSPKHPFLSTGCMFGHEARYLRKLADRTDCFIGSAPLGRAFKLVRNCPCTRHDYECDFNYVKSNDGTCKLVNGLNPIDHSEICHIDKNAFEYFEPTGYRKIPISTCEGGQEFDKWNPIPCPGKEGQFEKAHGGKLKGFGLAVVIVVPILIFVSAVWFVYEKGIRRNGGFARFGEIRLGDEDDLIENNTTDKVVNSIVRGGITVVAAVIATFKMIQILDAALINKVKGLFNRSNRSASRGEPYTTLSASDFTDHDEEALLGEVIDDEDYEIDDEEDIGAGFHDEELEDDDRNL